MMSSESEAAYLTNMGWATPKPEKPEKPEEAPAPRPVAPFDEARRLNPVGSLFNTPIKEVPAELIRELMENPVKPMTIPQPAKVTTIRDAPGGPGVVTGPLDLTPEAWREYDFGPADPKARVVYRITEPQQLYYRPGGYTHRVVDKTGTVHCVPAPGYNGCVLRWANKPGEGPVSF